MTAANAQSTMVADPFKSLEQILRAQLDGHQRLLQCLQRKREAIRKGQFGSLGSICNEESIVLRQFAEVDRHRIEIANRVAASLRKQGRSLNERMTLTEIAHLAPEPRKTRLITLAAQLRDISSEVKQQSSIVRSAAEVLGKHMAGIAQSVHSALGRAGVYGNRGRLMLGAPLQSIIDMKT